MLWSMETLAAQSHTFTHLDEGAYARPPANPALNPEVYARKLLLLPEHEHLAAGEAVIEWLLKRDEKVKAGRQVLGTCHMPRVQGELNPCFEWLLERFFGHVPNFLIILDRDWWFEATPLAREILCYHELSHAAHKKDRFGDPLYDAEERPVWTIAGHSIEEFESVVRRYGAWSPDLKSFMAAYAEHERQQSL